MPNFAFNASHSIADSLRLAMETKTRVTIHLESGATLTGRVSEVADEGVVLAELTQKEFFDALVPSGSIVAIEARVRNS